MFFLMRMAFWLTLVLVLLPTDKTANTDKSKSIDTMDAASAAAAAMSDMTQFCSRQPTACEVGGKAAVVIGERAQNGARKVYQFITEKDEKRLREDKPAGDERKDERKAAEDKKSDDKKAADSKKVGTDKARKSPDHTGSIGDRGPQTLDGTWRGTLSDDDLQIEWQPAAMTEQGRAD
jgi:hypothetical protein